MLMLRLRFGGMLSLCEFLVAQLGRLMVEREKLSEMELVLRLIRLEIRRYFHHHLRRMFLRNFLL